MIAKVVGVNQQRASQITNNANFGEIGNLVSQGLDMDYIARHYHMGFGPANVTRFALQRLRFIGFLQHFIGI
jgi:hypothetical protein